MNKEEFLRQLERLLSDIPEAERREALEYYRNYFEDAGAENELNILRELGSPEKVAVSIKKDLFGDAYREKESDSQSQERAALEKQMHENRVTRNILIVILLVLTSPVWLGLLGSLFGVFVALLACVFCIAAAGVAVVGALFVAGFVMAGIGIVNLFTGYAAVGLIVIAAGMICLIIAILGLIAAVWMIGAIIPWILRAVVRLCKRPFQKKGAAI